MDRFKKLIIIGRPAAGKSELIDFLKGVPTSERLRKYHIGDFKEIDDFVWIWEKLVEDDLWEEAGYERMWSFKKEGNPGLKKENKHLFDLMIAKFNREVAKYTDNFYRNNTLFIEFARGGENGYRNAFSRLSAELLRDSAILYIKVSAEESWRKNVARYKEKLKHSILAHMVPRETMEAFYKTDDWENMTGGNTSGNLKLNGVTVPFMTMNNEPELTDLKQLEERYGSALNQLWAEYANNQRQNQLCAKI